MPGTASTSESSSVLSGFIKWAGGIAASVIAAVLIYHFTRPPPTPIQSVDFYGVVADAASHALISNARVVVSLGTNSVSQQTDSLGKYNLVLMPASSGEVMGDIKISASGYQEYSNSVPLRPGGNFAEITLQSVHSPAAPAAVAAASGPTAGSLHIPLHVAGIVLRQPPPNFKRPVAAVMKPNH
jgi:hypothetical protein